MTSSFAHLVPDLTDGVVRLRAHSLHDVDSIVEQSRDADSQRWTLVPPTYTRSDAVDFLERIAMSWRDPTGTRTWAIEHVVDGRSRFCGTIDVRHGEAIDTASLGFGLHPVARGSGLMSRAVRLVADHAFRIGPWGHQLTRIHWRAAVGNWPSRRVAWATGFTFHGTVPAGLADPDDARGAAVDCWQASLGAGDATAPRLPWFEPVVLEGGGIRLRSWRDADIDAIEERNDPEHWMPARSVLGRDMFPGWLHTRRELMSEGRSVEWCIADGATDRALGGAVVFSRIGPMTADVAELGYQLFPSSRGRGVARIAAHLAIQHALAPSDAGGIGLRRLVAETAADNVASNRVLEHNGFVVYGREHAVDPMPDGSFGDGLHWELVPASQG